MTVVREDKKGCKTVECEDDEIVLLESGSSAIGAEDTWCEACPDYTKPNENDTECVAPSCPANSKILKDGTCMTCPPFFTPKLPERRECYRRVCLAAENKIVGEDG